MLQRLYYNDLTHIREVYQNVIRQKFALSLAYIQYLNKTYPNYIIYSLIDYIDMEVRLFSWAAQYMIINLTSSTWALFNNFSDLVCVDYLGRAKRFELIYLLLSIKYNNRIRVKILIDELIPVPSLVAYIPAVGWFEREIWDLYGVFFSGNFDLRRLLNDYGFLGHPLRKDFPLSGFFEVFYDDTEKRIVYEPVSLAQEYRVFKFNNPWLSL